MAFPTALTNAIDGLPGIGTLIVAAHLNNLEVKVGIDASTVVTSLDYLLKNPASINPGHKHSKLWASDGSPEAITVDAAGNVGIGTATPGNVLDVRAPSNQTTGISISAPNNSGQGSQPTLLFDRYNGSGTLSSRARIFSGSGIEGVTYGDLIFDTGNGTSPTTSMIIRGSGVIGMPHYGAGTATFDASGNISSVSDERLKTILGKYTGGIAQLNGIEPIVHKWNEKSGMEMEHEYVGFSAQNVQANMPEAVYENKEGYLSYSDKAIIAALVNTVKQQQIQIEAMQARLN